MANYEARNGPVALFGDLVWTKIGIEGSGVRTRSVGPAAVSIGASADVAIQMAILEAGGPMRSRASAWAGPALPSASTSSQAGGSDIRRPSCPSTSPPR